MKPLNIFGSPIDQPAVEQIKNCLQDERAVAGALMADHHLGYSMPIGGVVAYENAISPTGVGFDIACGNMAVKTNLHVNDFGSYVVKPIMRQIQKDVAFGLGRNNPTPIDHDLFDDPIWNWLEAEKPGLKAKAADQLGTVGSGNHYVDLLVDESGAIWIANHFGSRGLGHTIASGFMAMNAGLTFADRVPEGEGAIVFPTDSEIGSHYLACMELAGRYAYAGREYVIDQVLRILGARAVESVHNHHNYAWLENNLWVVRKGATPLTRELAFIGGSMGDVSTIVRGKSVIDIGNLNSAPHGAGRVMSRTKAAGKLRKMWYCPNHNCDFQPFRSVGDQTGHDCNCCPKCNIPLKRNRMRDTSDAAINWNEVKADLTERGIVVLGAGADEAPGVYKNLTEVLSCHPNIEIVHTLSPIGVVMAGSDDYDPYKD